MTLKAGDKVRHLLKPSLDMVVIDVEPDRKMVLCRWWSEWHRGFQKEEFGEEELVKWG